MDDELCILYDEELITCPPGWMSGPSDIGQIVYYQTRRDNNSPLEHFWASRVVYYQRHTGLELFNARDVHICNADLGPGHVLFADAQDDAAI